LAPMMRRSMRNLDDDEDVFDSTIYDPKYYPKRVYRDGKGPVVKLMLTDAAPPQRRQLYDASAHRPHYAEITDAAANRRAVESYEAHNKWLADAWRGPANPPPPEPEPDEDPRDAYIRRLSNAWKSLPDLPARDPDDDDDPKAAATAVEAQRRRWNAESPTEDAALADRDIAYGEYLDYLQNAWKRPCGVFAGGKR
jgi:hypothetical protein